MSNLKEWLHKRRGKFYEGETLKQHCDAFMEMVEGGAIVHEFEDAIIVLEPYGLTGNFRGWLLFDRFMRGVARAIKQVSDEFDGVALYASTHDKRIRDLLVKFGYTEYFKDATDYYLVKAR